MSEICHPTYDCVEEVAVVDKLPAATEGQLIDEMPLERIPDVEVRVPVVRSRIVSVLPVGGASVASPSRLCRGRQGSATQT